MIGNIIDDVLIPLYDEWLFDSFSLNPIPIKFDKNYTLFACQKNSIINSILFQAKENAWKKLTFDKEKFRQEPFFAFQMIDYILFQRKTSRNFSFEIEIDLMRSVCRWWHQSWSLKFYCYRCSRVMAIFKRQRHTVMALRLGWIFYRHSGKQNGKMKEKKKKMLIASIIPSKRYCQTKFSRIICHWCAKISFVFDLMS